jgi:nucleoside-triphosphatase THEP1
MHVFLTGLRGVGKTTIITRVVSGALADGTVSADGITGFRTVWAPARGAESEYGNGDVGFAKGNAGSIVECDENAAHNPMEKFAAEALYIVPYGTGRPESPVHSRSVSEQTNRPLLSGARAVAERDAANRSLTVHPEIFDEDGVAILRAATGGAASPGLIIMDELGFMEADALAFQGAVTDVLNGDVPVLGVMRWERNPFLDAVRAHEKVEVIEVNESNRDALPARLTARIFHG